MKNNILVLLCISILSFSCKKSTEKSSKTETKSEETTKKSNLEIYPISHATAVLTSAENVIYIDPTGGAEAFVNYDKPTLVFITDIHGDHLDIKTLEALDLSSAIIVAPKAVAEKISSLTVKEIIVMNNGDEKTLSNIKAEAIPMYNLREEALNFHPKGRGNGYLLTINDERIYFSGDTEDIPEMRSLKNIDKAFICMNLPYTMTVESAASAVLDFKPKQVYPYHYRGTDGMSDVAKFKTLVTEGNSGIEVVQLNWYQ